MPLTAAGRYEVSVVTTVDGKDKELCARTFRFVPVPRFALLFLFLILGVICRFRPRYWILTPQRRLVAIPLAAFLLMLMTPADGLLWFLSLAFAQLTGLSLLLLLAGSGRPIRPVVAVLLGYVASAAPAILVTLYITTSMWGGAEAIADRAVGIALTGCLAGLAWYAPALAGLFAVRQRYSLTRLLAGLGAGLAAVGFVAAGLFCIYLGSLYAAFIALGVIILASVYPGGLLIAMTTSPWCREGLIRTFHLDQDRPLPPPLPQNG